MATQVKLNGIISLPADFTQEIKVGETYTIEKDGFRIMPFGMPMELADDDNKYIGKVVVEELRAVPSKTFITFKVLKLFSPEESRVFSENFIKA